jgi:hypothetical protein
MSTTKIIIAFVVSIVILTVPLLVTYIWFPSVLGRYIGLVENVIAGVIGGLIITLLLDFTIRLRDERALDKVARVGLSEASRQTNRLMGLFAAMVKASSSGFLPSSIDDLFGSESAELISLHLDLYKPGPVMPQTSWPVYIENEIQYIMSRLSEIQNRYQAFFSGSSLAAIAELRINPLFIVLQHSSETIQDDKQMQIHRPVLNIPPDTMKQLMKDILTSIKTLQRDSYRLKTEDVPHFPHFEFQDNVLPKLGDARYEGPPGPPTFIGR